MAAGLLLARRYQLIEKLGSGGMGSVWRALDLTLNADVAVKLIDPEFASSSEAITRFRREAQSAAAIRSTHVVQILDHGVDGDKPFIAMELLKGENLGQRLVRVGHLSLESTKLFLGQVARAIALAHENGIVHRDLKPDNIFLVREYGDEITKVLDFGVARHHGGLADSGGLHTRTGMLLGTPYYMSPEQASGQAVNFLTDIWSFGVIACECLSGKRIFASDTLGGLFHAICMAPMPVPSQVGSVPVGFDAWFARAAARDTAERFQSIMEASDALQLLARQTSSRPSAVSEPAGSDNTVQSPEAVPPEALAAPDTSPVATLGVSPVVPELQLTAPPSSHSIPAESEPIRGKSKLIAFAAAAIIIGGLCVGWYSMWGSGTTLTAASVSASVTTVQSLAQSATEPPPIADVSNASAALTPLPTTSSPEPLAQTQENSRQPVPAKPQETNPGSSEDKPKRVAPAKQQKQAAPVQSIGPRPQHAAPVVSVQSPAKAVPVVAPNTNDRLGI